MAREGGLFSVGELVQIIDPGWIWDGMQADVLDIELPSAAACHQEVCYTVRVRWPDGPERRYVKWQHQLALWDDELVSERSGGDGA